MSVQSTSAMTTATFRLPPDLKERIDELARKTNRSSSYFYSQLVADHIDELEDIYECISLIEDVKKGKEKTVPLEKVIADYGL